MGGAMFLSFAPAGNRAQLCPGNLTRARGKKEHPRPRTKSFCRSREPMACCVGYNTPYFAVPNYQSRTIEEKQR